MIDSGSDGLSFGPDMRVAFHWGEGTLRLFLNTLLLMSFLLDFGIFSSSLSTPFSQHYALRHLTRLVIYHILLDIGLVKIFKLQMNSPTRRC